VTIERSEVTVAAAILDEVAFWSSEGPNPDHEVLTALRPAMSTIPGAKLICISTPYSQSGALYEAHKEYFGRDDEHTMVWVSDTRTMNPTISEELIQREMERDPEAASSEWLATFRSDLSAAFSVESLEACTIKGRGDLPPSSIIQYQAFVDPSGGKGDAYTVAIGHKSDKVVIDVARAWPSPLDPKIVTSEVSEILKAYGISTVTGDRYGGEWPTSEFREHGISYEQSVKPKSELYLAFIPVTNSGDVELPDDKRLFNELRRLERRRGRLGKDSVDHPPRLHDDLANAVAGLSDLLVNEDRESQSGFNAAKHVSSESLPLLRAVPIVVGLTLTNPIASVIGQAGSDGTINVYVAFASTGGLKHHLETHLRPWIYQHAGWTLHDSWQIQGCHENVEETAQVSLLQMVTDSLPGDWQPAMMPIEARRESLLAALSRARPFTFEPLFQIDPGAELVAPALSRQYDPRDKTVYSAVNNALGLLASRLSARIDFSNYKPPQTESKFDPRQPIPDPD
jgi:hypothetical protein